MTQSQLFDKPPNGSVPHHDFFNEEVAQHGAVAVIPQVFAARVLAAIATAYERVKEAAVLKGNIFLPPEIHNSSTYTLSVQLPSGFGFAGVGTYRTKRKTVVVGLRRKRTGRINEKRNYLLLVFAADHGKIRCISSGPQVRSRERGRIHSSWAKT